MILTANQLLSDHRHKTARVAIAEGQEVIVRSLPSHVIEKAQQQKSADAWVFVNAVVDEQGKRLFKDEQAEEVAECVAADIMQLVTSKAFALSAVSSERKEEIKKNWEILRGSNSGEPPSASDSPTPT
jgi:hypothetical protein